MSDYIIAHLDAIHVTLTPNEALTDDNKIEALNTASFTQDNETVELKHLNDENEGHSDYESVWSTTSGTLSGNAKKNSATQAILANAHRNRTSFYVHMIENKDAAVGQPKGTLYHLLTQSGEKPREAGALVTFSYEVVVKGKPKDILGS